MRPLPKYRQLWYRIKEVPGRKVRVFVAKSHHAKVMKALRNERAADKTLQDRKFYQLTFADITATSFTAEWKPLPAAACVDVLNQPLPISVTLEQSNDTSKRSK